MVMDFLRRLCHGKSLRMKSIICPGAKQSAIWSQGCINKLCFVLLKCKWWTGRWNVIGFRGVEEPNLLWVASTEGKCTCIPARWRSTWPGCLVFIEGEAENQHVNVKAADLMETCLQSNGSWQPGESSGSFITFLAKHTLLSSWTCLTITALGEIRVHKILLAGPPGNSTPQIVERHIFCHLSPFLIILMAGSITVHDTLTALMSFIEVIYSHI